MRSIFALRVWASIGVLLLAAGMPYCAAAMSWGVTEDETSLTVRADIAAGVVVASLGWTVLTIVALIWLVRRARRRA